VYFIKLASDFRVPHDFGNKLNSTIFLNLTIHYFEKYSLFRESLSWLKKSGLINVKFSRNIKWKKIEMLTTLVDILHAGFL
jgi:hypothetical protein